MKNITGQEREMIDFTHATTKAPGRVFTDMIFAYFVSENKYTALVSTGGAVLPIGENEQELLNRLKVPLAPVKQPTTAELSPLIRI